jgi:anaerobic selenocysteine-containing dehydrogenase
MNVIKTACELCAWSCGMNVYVEGGKITRVSGMNEHPLNRGRLCPKGSVSADYVYAKDRITYPMVREGDKWQRIEWDDAIDMVAENLKEVAKINPKAFATIIGMPILLGGSSTVSFIRRFMDVYGTPNCFSPESMCYRHQIIGYILTLGKFPVADPENANCIIVWAHNPHASKPPLAWMIERARKRGAKLIVIDPRKTKVAEMADIHAAVRPGSDTYLAIGLMKVIIEEELYDRDFVANYCYGFDKLREHVSKYSLDEIAEKTWVDVETITEIARTFATVKPGCIVQGVNALDQVPTGVQNSRAVAILHALTGNIDVKGGFVRAARVHTRNLRLHQLLKDLPLGIEQHPFFYQVWETHLGEGQGMYLYDAVLEGEPYQIKSLFIAGSNPVLTWPESAKMLEVLKKVEFLVVMDMFMTETAKHADLFLPAASFLERLELVDYYSVIFGIPYMMLRKKAIEPPGEAKSDVEFWLELARKMGYREYFPWKSVDEVLDYVLEPTGYTLDDLTEKYPSGVWTGKVRYGEYKERGFRTPSGKVELYSESLVEKGYDAIPTPKEPSETPYSSKAEKYPLILTTGARNLYFTHSQLRNVEKMLRLQPEAYVEIHPETAERFGIKDGEIVTVRTERGSIEIRAKVTDTIVPGVINIPHGWSSANANILTSRRPADPISGCPELKALLAKREER